MVKKRIDAIVSADEKRIPPPYGKVSASARTLFALVRYTNATRHEIRNCLGLMQSDIDRMFRLMRKDVFAKSIITCGLPAMFGESLPEDVFVQCSCCGKYINWVPCVACCKHEEDFLDRTDRHRAVHGEDVPPESDEPTMFPPGSPQKVSVMKYRVDMGLQPFCSRDAKGVKRV
jgi:hypothetical protein